MKKWLWCNQIHKILFVLKDVLIIYNNCIVAIPKEEQGKRFK